MFTRSFKEDSGQSTPISVLKGINGLMDAGSDCGLVDKVFSEDLEVAGSWYSWWSFYHSPLLSHYVQFPNGSFMQSQYILCFHSGILHLMCTTQVLCALACTPPLCWQWVLTSLIQSSECFPVVSDMEDYTHSERGWHLGCESGRGSLLWKNRVSNMIHCTCPLGEAMCMCVTLEPVLSPVRKQRANWSFQLVPLKTLCYFSKLTWDESEWIPHDNLMRALSVYNML